MSRAAATGAVLGIDVGYSAQRASTVFARLSWNERQARLRFAAATLAPASRAAALDSCLADGPVSGVAIDGPLSPRQGGRRPPQNHHRAAESLLSRGVLVRRGKAGALNTPSGQQLHAQALALAAQLEAAQPAAWIIEAFPNAWLMAQMREAAFTPLRRNASDVFWQQLLEEGRLDAGLRRWLPGRALQPALATITDHDQRAAAVCAFTALGWHCGEGLAVGNPAEGLIVLPPAALWGEGAHGPWLGPVLDANLAALRRQRPDPATGLYPAAALDPPSGAGGG
ncbi:MAG TPA: hypothetical protein VFV27_08160 [Nevskiaceae bacterium]|nr:hypothetical protein [Nevskiaceae bacterium]